MLSVVRGERRAWWWAQLTRAVPARGALDSNEARTRTLSSRRNRGAPNPALHPRAAADTRESRNHLLAPYNILDQNDAYFFNKHIYILRRFVETGGVLEWRAPECFRVLGC